MIDHLAQYQPWLTYEVIMILLAVGVGISFIKLWRFGNERDNVGNRS